MTVLAYFNSLKELGGARRIIEEEVQNTLKEYGARRRIGERAGAFSRSPEILRSGGVDLARSHRQGG